MLSLTGHCSSCLTKCTVTISILCDVNYPAIFITYRKVTLTGELALQGDCMHPISRQHLQGQANLPLPLSMSDANVSLPWGCSLTQVPDGSYDGTRGDNWPQP